MKLIMFPLLLSLAVIGFEHKDKIIDQYNAAYPTDPAKAVAIAQCALNPNFNRLDSDDRHDCYARLLERAPVALAPSPSPYYAYSPSHLAGNDIRRLEANDGYRGAIALHSARTMPTVPTAVSLPAQARTVAVVAAHRATVTHTTRNSAKPAIPSTLAPRA